MARKPRDHKAAYRRRVELAKQRGFKSYYDQRKKIERGETKAIQPSRLRNRKTIEVQNDRFGIFGGSAIDKDTEKWLASVNIKDARIDMAQRWSNFYSRHVSTRFDAERAKTDERYLTVYMQAFVLAPHSDRNVHDFDGSDWQYEWFVDIVGYLEADTYDDRYGDGTNT